MGTACSKRGCRDIRSSPQQPTPKKKKKKKLWKSLSSGKIQPEQYEAPLPSTSENLQRSGNTHVQHAVRVLTKAHSFSDTTSPYPIVNGTLQPQTLFTTQRSTSLTSSPSTNPSLHDQAMFTNQAEIAIGVLDRLKKLADPITLAEVNRLQVGIRERSLFEPVLTETGKALLLGDAETAMFVQAGLLNFGKANSAGKGSDCEDRVNRIQSHTSHFATISIMEEGSNEKDVDNLRKTLSLDSNRHQVRDVMWCSWKAEGCPEWYSPTQDMSPDIDVAAWEYTWDNIDSRHFDVWLLDGITNHPMVVIFWVISYKLTLMDLCKINIKKAAAFIRAVEKGYRANPYHSPTHGADVMQGFYWLVTPGGLQKRANLPPIEIFAALIAAAIHDFDHPGYSNSFLVNTHDKLAVLYNDQSVLEAHSCASGFKMMINREDCNILDGLDKTTKKLVRKLVVEIVLATDMSGHAGHVAELKQFRENGFPTTCDCKARQILLKNAVKAADIGNPTRPWHIYQKWVGCVMTEFFQQGDAEKDRGIGVSPFCDRACQQIAKCQNGFINFIVLPLIQLWAHCLPDSAQLLDQLLENSTQIKEQVVKFAASQYRLSAVTSAITNEPGRFSPWVKRRQFTTDVNVRRLSHTTADDTALNNSNLRRVSHAPDDNSKLVDSDILIAMIPAYAPASLSR